MTQKYDRMNLEEEIMNVWQTRDDLDAITDRILDDPNGPMTEDEIGNVLIGLSELFETMIQQKNSFIMMTEEATLGDVLDKIVDDAEKEDNESNTRI